MSLTTGVAIQPSGLAPPSKPFTWSYSQLKNFESCAKRHYHVDKLKDFKEEDSEQLQWGNAVHAALAKRCSKGIQLPIGMTGYEKWCANIDKMPGDPIVEQKLAITRDFEPCGYFDKGVWLRAVVDVAKLTGPVAWMGDWKTGKILEDAPQLGISASVLFAHQPQLQAVKTNFIWLKDNAPGTDVVFRRDDMGTFWAGLLPRVAKMERAYLTTTYQAEPGRLCRNWCPVKSCPHFGT